MLRLTMHCAQGDVDETVGGGVCAWPDVKAVLDASGDLTFSVTLDVDGSCCRQAGTQSNQ